MEKQCRQSRLTKGKIAQNPTNAGCSEQGTTRAFAAVCETACVGPMGPLIHSNIVFRQRCSRIHQRHLVGRSKRDEQAACCPWKKAILVKTEQTPFVIKQSSALARRNAAGWGVRQKEAYCFVVYPSSLLTCSLNCQCVQRILRRMHFQISRSCGRCGSPWKRALKAVHAVEIDDARRRGPGPARALRQAFAPCLGNGSSS